MTLSDSDLNGPLNSSDEDDVIEELLWNIVVNNVIKSLRTKSEVKRVGSQTGRVKSKARDYQASYEVFQRELVTESEKDFLEHTECQNVYFYKYAPQ
jgi:hypothetical protein